MKKTYTILLLLISVLVQGQTITSENKLIQQGLGFYDPQEGGFRNEDFPLNLELFRSQTRLWRLKNSTGKTLSIIIDFEKLIGATATERLPFVKTVGPGVHTLFELKSTGTTTFDYSYLFYYTESILVTQPADFDYLLPVDESEEVTLVSYNYDADEPYVSPIKYADGVSQFYGLEFKPENSKNIKLFVEGLLNSQNQPCQKVG